VTEAGKSADVMAYQIRERAAGVPPATRARLIEEKSLECDASVLIALEQLALHLLISRRHVES
jgi:hypothetical protein